ncbi:hypothetical protein D5R81_00010 [Parashewanella spongiae]|uniref:Uncharacterized protein n=1 Tax=Parashewanella spongiae TaxID=342950 RepID=A0A3A6U259_9GAMM|nr:hypothetical protein [Parashewanella spongiae]MCL1076567.1 hypothetical protein [Parashewanella spongiae]RJY19526.1 hypothetical protein D5R81_00010 [Parashewanella spongiae]
MNSKILTLSCLVLLITACGQKDRAYYEANLDDAREKAQECNKEMVAALKAEDQSKLQKISDDSECKFAAEVHAIQERKIADIKREIERKKRKEEHENQIKEMAAQLEKQKKEREAEQARRQKEEAERKRAFEAEYQRSVNSLTAMKFSDFSKQMKDCGYKRSSAQCKAVHEIKDSKRKAEIVNLIKLYPEDKLKDFKSTKCKGLDINREYCSLATKAIRKQDRDKVEFYVSNKDSFKKDFNECHKVYIGLTKAKYGQEKPFRDRLQTFQCRVVRDAAMKYNIWNFKKPVA